MSVKDYMTRKVVMIGTEATIREAIGLLRKHRIKGIPVVSQSNKVVGMFTMKHLLYILEDGTHLDTPVKAVMHPDVTYIAEDTPLEETCTYPRKRLPVLDKEGNVVGILTKSDIIRGFKAESEGAKQHLKAVLEAAPQALLAVNRDSRVTFINPAAEKMLGIDSDLDTGKPLAAILPDCETFQRLVLEQGQVIQGGINTVRGCQYVANAAPVVDDCGIAGGVISLQPMSDLELLAEELNVVKQLCKELDAVIESSYDGIFVADNQGVLLKINAASARLLGMVPEKVLYQDTREVAREHHLSSCITAMVIHEKKAQSVSYKLNGKTVALTGSPVFDEQGNLIRVIANVRDLSELSSLRQELEQATRLKERYYSELACLKAKVAPTTESFRSEEMQRIYDLALRVAVVDTPILIQGESGAGKEVLANYIHANSTRKDQPFVKINCAAIPETLLESELFGYVDGAFTGAKKGGKPGVFEIASGGTLFLDEIGELPGSIQAKLLRALQDQEVFKLGASKPVRFDVRFLFATNRRLEQEVSEGRFREDLFYRINVVPIIIPPLRERPADIAFLAAAYLDKFNAKYNTDKRLSPAAAEIFTAYGWPGNVRELINVIERLVITCQQDSILPGHLPRNMVQQASQRLAGKPGALLPLRDVLEMVEREVIERSMRECRSLRQAARTLGIDPSTLLRKADKYRIQTVKQES